MGKDWKKFYKEADVPKDPSSFAKFVRHLKLPGESLIGLGCGNGRDVRAFKRYGSVCGVDKNCVNQDTKKIKYLNCGWEDAKDVISSADIVYSRFFLHAISPDEVKEIISLTSGYFCAEARAVGDVPVLYADHDRNFIDGNNLLTTLIRSGFEILYYQLGYGLAKYKNEDPLIVRVIAKKI